MDRAEADRLIVARVSELSSRNAGFGAALRAVAGRAQEQGWRAALFGGAVLDAVLGATPRDVDCVVSAPRGWEYQLAGVVSRRRVNGLGGQAGLVRGYPADLWELASTPGFRDLGLEPSFESLPRTAFFNANAVAVELDGPDRLGPVHDAGFAAAMFSARLEVVNPVTRFPAVQAAAAARLVARGFSVGDSLAEWLRASGVTRRSAERVYAARYGGPPGDLNAIAGLLA